MMKTLLKTSALLVTVGVLAACTGGEGSPPASAEITIETGGGLSGVVTVPAVTSPTNDDDTPEVNEVSPLELVDPSPHQNLVPDSGSAINAAASPEPVTGLLTGGALAALGLRLTGRRCRTD